MPRVFISSEDIGVGKPAPYPYLRAAWGLNQPIEHCIVVEDAPAGIQSAKSAGARIIAVQTTNSPDALQEADFLVNEISDLAIGFNGSSLRVSLDL
jgi:sugar-phosphatase